MRKIDYIVLTLCSVTLGYLSFSGAFSKPEQSETKVEVTTSYEQTVYNINYNEYLTLKQHAEKYEKYLASVALDLNSDLKNLSEDGKLVSISDLNKVYSSSVSEDYKLGVSYYYDQSKEYLTQVVLVKLDSARIETYVNVVYNSDYQVVDSFVVRQEPYL